MNNTTTRLNNAFKWLIAAFFGGTLAKGTCAACAVGTITAGANHVKLTKIPPTYSDPDGIKCVTPIDLRMRMRKAGLCSKLPHAEWRALFFTPANKEQILTLTPQTREQRIKNSLGYVYEKLLGNNLNNIGAREEMKAQIANDIIAATGYTPLELAQVESAFEKNTSISALDYPRYTEEEVKEDQFRGLCAVMDVLCSLEGIDSTSYKEAFEYKLPDFFPKNPELIDELV